MRAQTRRQMYQKALHRMAFGSLAVLLLFSTVVGTFRTFNAHAATPVYQWAQDIGHRNYFQSGGYQLLGTSDGGFYISDTFGYAVERYDNAGNFVSRIDVKDDASYGAPAYTYAIATDTAGNLYVGASDGVGASIRKYGSNGTLLTKIGTPGSSNGQFDAPIYGLTVDGQGNIFASGRYDARIQKFDASGNFVAIFGSQGSGDGQFQFRPSILATANALYAVDAVTNRVQMFDLNGTYLSQFGTAGTGDGQLSLPSSIALDTTGNLLVVDRGNNRVQTFTTAGAYVSQFPVGQYLSSVAPGSSNTFYTLADSSNVVRKVDATGATLATIVGNSDASLRGASQLFVGADDALYALDQGNQRVQKFDKNGQFVQTIVSTPCAGGSTNSIYGATVDAAGNVYVVTGGFGDMCIKKYNTSGVSVAEFSSQGTGDGQIGATGGVITTDGVSKLYIADGSKHVVSVFDLNGTYISQFGTAGSGDGQFSNALYSITFKNSKVYVNDLGNQRILRFAADGTYEMSYNTPGTSQGAYGVAVDSDGFVYTADRLGANILRYQPSGATVPSFSVADAQQTPTAMAIDSQNTLYVLGYNPGTTVSRYDRVIVNAPSVAPSNLMTTDVQSRAVSISWEMPGAGIDTATDFKVRARAAGESTDAYSAGVSNATSTTITELEPDTDYTIYVSGGNVDGFGPETTLNVHTATAPPRAITSVAFSQEAEKKIMTINGTELVGYADPEEYVQALSRSLVQLNGTNLPFCTEGLGMTAQEMIDGYSAAFPNIAQQVSDGPGCYFLVRDGVNPTITTTQAVVWLPDTFDTSAQGTVSVNGVAPFTFNTSVGPGGDIPPTAGVGGTKPLDQHPTIAPLSTFSGVATPGATVTVTVHSDPVTCTTTADSNGNWSCTLPTSLPAGEHTVYVHVVNPDESVQDLGPYSVTVAAGAGGTVTNTTPKAPNTGIFEVLKQYKAKQVAAQHEGLLLSAGVGLLVAAIGAVSTFGITRGLRLQTRK